MDPSLSSLLAALDQAHAAGDERRLLGLLRANLFRFPEAPSLRRYAWRSALAQGDLASTAAIMERTLTLELAAGNLLHALAALRAAENAGIELAVGWQEVFSELSQRGFDTGVVAPLQAPVAPTELQVDALADAAEAYATAAAEPPGRSERSRFAAVPWFSTLDAATLRLSLPLLDGARIDPGTRFAVAESPPAWLVVGDLRDDFGAGIPPGAALVGEEMGNVTAWSTCWLVTFPAPAWEQILQDPSAARQWSFLLLRRRFLRALQSLPVLTLHGDPGLREALRTSRLSVWRPGLIVLPESATARYLTVLKGVVEVIGAGQETVCAYRAGDTVELRSLRGMRLRAPEDVELATFDLDEAVDEELLSGELQVIDTAL